ncbi:MAG: hypothetical protein M1821_006191 [Bathelium mastoideum]|nr:MAG: hypothetical protein M1821_006191 [Bathelium mastoideum]
MNNTVELSRQGPFPISFDFGPTTPPSPTSPDYPPLPPLSRRDKEERRKRAMKRRQSAIRRGTGPSSPPQRDGKITALDYYRHWHSSIKTSRLHFGEGKSSIAEDTRELDDTVSYEIAQTKGGKRARVSSAASEKATKALKVNGSKLNLLETPIKQPSQWESIYAHAMDKTSPKDGMAEAPEKELLSLKQQVASLQEELLSREQRMLSREQEMLSSEQEWQAKEREWYRKGQELASTINGQGRDIDQLRAREKGKFKRARSMPVVTSEGTMETEMDGIEDTNSSCSPDTDMDVDERSDVSSPQSPDSEMVDADELDTPQSPSNPPPFGQTPTTAANGDEVLRGKPQPRGSVDTEDCEMSDDGPAVAPRASSSERMEARRKALLLPVSRPHRPDVIPVSGSGKRAANENVGPSGSGKNARGDAQQDIRGSGEPRRNGAIPFTMASSANTGRQTQQQDVSRKSEPRRCVDEDLFEMFGGSSS